MTEIIYRNDRHRLSGCCKSSQVVAMYRLLATNDPLSVGLCVTCSAPGSATVHALWLVDGLLITLSPIDRH